MKSVFRSAGLGALGLLALAGVTPSRAAAQDPILTPIIVSEAAPIIVNVIKPKPKPGVQKFEGLFLHANIAQVTVKARGDDPTVQTFVLSQAAADKMQKIIDSGGYQYGDKITVYYDTQSLQALKVKGKPSRPL
jgi:hypothetical protein